MRAAVGGSDREIGNGIAIDHLRRVHVTGDTNSTDFPVVNALDSNFNDGPHDIFIAKLNASGSALAYSTYLGGENDDTASGIALDGFGSAYVVGSTESPNFPVAHALDSTFNGGPTSDTAQDAFIAKLNPAGNILLFSTFLGGNDFDAGIGIAVQTARAVYVTGLTTSTNFPVKNALDSTQNGRSDAFVTKIDSTVPPVIAIPQ